MVEFVDDTIPAGAGPNPYTEVVQAMGVTSTTAKRFSLSAGTPAELEELVKVAKRQLSDAGSLCDPQRSVRKTVALSDDKLSAVVKFWTTAKIVQARADKPAESEASAAPAAPAPKASK